MAEALVSVLLEQLASIIHQQVEKHVTLVVNVEKDVENLTHNFRAIGAVLKDAEERQVKEASVKLWLDDLKDVSNEMEDVLDDWNTGILRLHIEKQEKEESGNAVDTTKKKVRLCIHTAFFCSGKVSRVIYRHDIAQKIKDLNERLATIANWSQNLNFQYTKSGTKHVERQKTTSFVDQTFGRVDEKELLVAKLLSKSNPEGQSSLVIPIVGMGGIGKTTLSQLAYNDDRVKANFTKQIWVCVSEPFDELNIAKDIIGQLDGNVNSISSNLEAYFQCVRKSIEGEKFLLVLDDVWNEDYGKWEKLKIVLQKGDVGSKIVVTTRKEEVAGMMGAADNTINLKVLSDENCWLLFNRIAFTDRNQDECKILDPIGREIVKKCKGLPLVAKTLGGLMRVKKTKKEWQDVLSNEIWELDTLFGQPVSQQVFQPLLLSYYDLDPIIKRCLLYCGTFPKNHIIDKNDLIELWMSQSYFGSIRNTEKTTVDIGESYFSNLVTRYFFQDFVKDKFGKIKRCKMHDIVHDFLQFLTKNECSVLDVQGKTNVEVPVRNKIRHLTITSARDGPFSVSFDSRGSLRTLATFSCQITSLNQEFVSQLKCVRTLNLSNNRVEELPEKVGGLVHLRYLDLSCNNWKRLPDTLCNLINLETLRLEKCRGLEELPEGMGKLTNLRHLRVKNSNALKLPKSIAKLTSLQTLDQVNIFHDGSKASDLRNMDQLQGKLEVCWWKPVNDAAKKYAEQVNLVNKKHLVSLTLSLWDAERDSIIQEEILNALQPNPNLEALKIAWYSGTTLCPRWLNVSLHNLKHLAFHACYGCEFLPLLVLGKLVSLEILRFRKMRKLKKVGHALESSSSSSSSLEVTLFPKLKKLVFVGLEEWEEWEGMPAGLSEDSLASIKVMPDLSTLEIENCYKLKTLPDFLWKTPLQNLSINRSRILREGMEWHKISHIPNIKIDHVIPSRLIVD
ncbi:PREDICTED: putative disease resistance protein RGA3 [Fragaria vesca subsp. vesca]|uniref:putative disease resistance protein RGA3 n=1 Tax=Fragaria vesca subsp. vesca TaxID=101020 RepID=UPI0002C3458D|nr:PREDICTED: putative disease resistance protein RGA3 [Fragaria vesca subsp. vesca]